MTAIIGWAPILAPWSDRTLQQVERQVPRAQFEAAMRFHRWQDRQARLLTRLVLRAILHAQSDAAASLDDMATTPEGRPYIAGCGDFSIAHTASVAMCAFVREGRVGLDVETSRPGLAIADMLPWMSGAERRVIAASPTPMDQALGFWTAKEAVCKADGCGIASGELPDCAGPMVHFRGKLWRVRSRRVLGHTLALARAAGEPWRSFRFRLDEQAIAA